MIAVIMGSDSSLQARVQPFVTSVTEFMNRLAEWLKSRRFIHSVKALNSTIQAHIERTVLTESVTDAESASDFI